jgi:nucleoside 2-deoxyribosyltransferase
MKVVYVAGPYRDPGGPWYVQENIRRAAEVARVLWTMGFAVICPHLNAGNMEGLGLPEEWILAGDLEMVERCDLLVVLPGWKTSKGTRGEIDHANAKNIPVFFWSDFGAEDELEHVAKTPPAERRGDRVISVREAAAILGRHAAERRIEKRTAGTVTSALFPEAA